MTVREAAAIVLLGIAVAALAVSAIGVSISRNTYNRLHAGAVANVVTVPCVVAAIVVEKLASQAAIKSVLIGLVFLVCSPIVTHVIARSAHATNEA